MKPRKKIIGFYILVVEGKGRNFKRIGLKLEKALIGEKTKNYWFDTDSNAIRQIIDFYDIHSRKKKQKPDRFLCQHPEDTYDKRMG
jgi:hypothetical protein